MNNKCHKSRTAKEEQPLAKLRSQGIRQINEIPNLKHHEKEYPQPMETVVEMEKGSMLYKRCLSPSLTSTSTKQVLHQRQKSSYDTH